MQAMAPVPLSSHPSEKWHQLTATRDHEMELIIWSELKF